MRGSGVYVYRAQLYFGTPAEAHTSTQAFRSTSASASGTTRGAATASDASAGAAAATRASEAVKGYLRVAVSIGPDIASFAARICA